MKIIKIFSFIIVLLAFVSANSFAKGDILIFGTMNFINSSGSASDYKEGENDFPIKNSHQTNGFGLGISFPIIKNLSIGFEGHYNLRSKATLQDPSDNDTVEIDTYKNSSLFLTLGLSFLNTKNISIFLNGGGGINFLMENDTKFYTSKLGYETQILPPKGRTNLTGFGGVGIMVKMNSKIGILANARYIYISYEDNPENGFQIMGGLNIRF